jgi:hypothetical protein
LGDQAANSDSDLCPVTGRLRSGRIFDVMKAAGIIYTISDVDDDQWPNAA